MKYLLPLLMILPLNAFATAIVKIESESKSAEYLVHKVTVSGGGALILFFNDASGAEAKCWFESAEMQRIGQPFDVMKELSSDKKYEVTCTLNKYNYYEGSSITTGM
jgi:hypothetical protein